MRRALVLAATYNREGTVVRRLTSCDGLNHHQPWRLARRRSFSNRTLANPGGDDDDGGDGVRKAVKDYYGKVLSTSKDLKTSACTSSSRPHPLIANAIKRVPEAVREKFYGCGNPLPAGSLEGLKVLDLGSGSGRDCYVLANLVGANGFVTGIDMTAEQLDVARAHAEEYCLRELGYPRTNLKFQQGYIEAIREAGIPDGSQDLIVSNCVINLSPDKPAVVKGMYAALREGGEAFFSDVYCDRRLPESVRKNEVLWGECLAGALYEEDFRRLARAAGFADPRVYERAPLEVTDPELREILGNANFYSVTYRLFKISSLESLCEDYGQVAIYNGTIEGNRHAYALDDHHHFETGRPMLVCGNTASMVGETRLRHHFRVIGDRSTHFGLFPCGPSGGLISEGNAANSTCDVSGGCCG